MVFTEDKDLKSQKNYMETIDAFKSRCHVFHPKMGYNIDTREISKSRLVQFLTRAELVFR